MVPDSVERMCRTGELGEVHSRRDVLFFERLSCFIYLLFILSQIETHPGYYAKLVNQCKDKNTLAAEEIERDLHRSVIASFVVQ